MRKKIVAGNWKMNKNPFEAVEFAKKLQNEINNNNYCESIIFVPSIDLFCISEVLKASKIKIGAQNFYFENNGAYTGEISAQMLKEIDVNYALVGHSERRILFGETDEVINKKIAKALEYKITPVLCVGENLEERENNLTVELIRLQIKRALKNINLKNAGEIIIAYEPIWAIGTGKTADKNQAQEICREIRKVLGEIYNLKLASQIRILYGGSVNLKNAEELFEMQDIDGGLIGGASLTEDFILIANNICKTNFADIKI